MKHIKLFEAFIKESITADKESTAKELILLMGPSKTKEGNRVGVEENEFDLNRARMEVDVDLLDKEALDRINAFMDEKGWFPASVTDEEGYTHKYSKKIDQMLGKRGIMIQYEAKEGGESYPSKGKAYHITPDIYLPFIQREGLALKAESKLSDHPQRIYLLLNPEGTFKPLASRLWYSSRNKDEIKKYYVLEVDLSLIPQHSFYDDPQASLSYVGIYTTQPIPTQAIKVIQEIPTSELKEPSPESPRIKLTKFTPDKAQMDKWDKLIAMIDQLPPEEQIVDLSSHRRANTESK